MHRNLEEVLKSQRAMLDRLGRRGARVRDEELMRAYTQQLVRVQKWLKDRPEIAVLSVHYAEAVEHPEATAERLAGFLGAPFDAAAARTAVDAGLRRQRATESEAAAGEVQTG